MISGKIYQAGLGEYHVRIDTFTWDNDGNIPYYENRNDYIMFENGLFDSPKDSIGGPVKSQTAFGFSDNQVRTIYGNLGGSSFIDGSSSPQVLPTQNNEIEKEETVSVFDKNEKEMSQSPFEPLNNNDANNFNDFNNTSQTSFLKFEIDTTPSNSSSFFDNVNIRGGDDLLASILAFLIHNIIKLLVFVFDKIKQIFVKEEKHIVLPTTRKDPSLIVGPVIHITSNKKRYLTDDPNLKFEGVFWKKT